MKKKTYEQPRVEVVKVEQTDIICTSTQADFQSYDEEDDRINPFSGRW